MKARQLYDWGRRYITVPLLGVIIFLGYVCFFNDENTILDRMKYERRIEELKAEIADNRDSLYHYHHLNVSLETDRENIERVVREHYHMQRDNEDIYLFEQ